MPSVSVVIPAFNHAPFVGEAIRSVLEQSLSDFEIVITDDGSRDGTPDVVRQFSDPRIKLDVFPKNRGAVIALNSAIRRSRGEYISMLSSDDYFLPGKLDIQTRFLRNNPNVAAIFALPRYIDEAGDQLPHSAAYPGNVFNLPFTLELRSRRDWLSHFFFRGNCLCHPAAMVRRSAYDEIGLFDPRFANLPDFDMWVRLCTRYDIHVDPQELIAMRILEGQRNMSAPRPDTRVRALIEYYQLLKHYRGFPPELFAEVFARELASHPEWSSLSQTEVLAEIALSVSHPCHKLFALDTLLEQAPGESMDYLRLYELTGGIDIFAKEMTARRWELEGRLNAAQAEIAVLKEQLTRVSEVSFAGDLPNT